MQGKPPLRRGRLRHGDSGLVDLSCCEPPSLLLHAWMSLLWIVR